MDDAFVISVDLNCMFLFVITTIDWTTFFSPNVAHLHRPFKFYWTQFRPRYAGIDMLSRVSLLDLEKVTNVCLASLSKLAKLSKQVWAFLFPLKRPKSQWWQLMVPETDARKRRKKKENVQNSNDQSSQKMLQKGK